MELSCYGNDAAPIDGHPHHPFLIHFTLVTFVLTVLSEIIIRDVCLVTVFHTGLFDTEPVITTYLSCWLTL